MTKKYISDLNFEMKKMQCMLIDSKIDNMTIVQKGCFINNIKSNFLFLL